MNIKKLRIFVEALNDLPDEIKKMEVDMGSIDRPTAETCGCHAGLIHFVGDYIPELDAIYEVDKYPYLPRFWADALGKFLGLEHIYEEDAGDELMRWASMNPKLWGNKNAFYMFCDIKAFNNPFGNPFGELTYSWIIDHWTGVLKRVEKAEKFGLFCED